VNVTVNGDAAAVDDGCTVQRLVEARVESVRGVAVAVNAEVVPRSTWPSHTLVDGDHIELLTAAQGG
jgi:sulfur carrier protein